MASIKKIENKKGISYKITVSLGYDANGKKSIKCTTFIPEASKSIKQQEKDAQKYSYEFEEKVKKGEYFDGNKLTFEELARKWLGAKERDVSYNTYSSYDLLLSKNIIPYFKAYKTAQIKIAHIEEFYKTLADEGYACGSIKKCSVILNMIFKMAIRWEIIGRNPCTDAIIPRSKSQEPEIKFFTPNQCLTFIKSLDLEFETIYKSHERIDDTGIPYHVNAYTETKKVPTQFKVFYYLALFCGLRRGELLALHWDDIDLEKRIIHVKHSLSKSASGTILKDTKTAAGKRTVTFPESLLPLLKQYKQEYNLYKIKLGSYWKGAGNIFIQDDGSYMSLSAPIQRFKNHLKKYNEWVYAENKKQGRTVLEKLPIIPLHGLRHSCATLLNHLGTNIVEISDILGHAQTSTTVNIYAHSFEEAKYEASNKMDAFIRTSER